MTLSISLRQVRDYPWSELLPATPQNYLNMYFYTYATSTSDDMRHSGAFIRGKAQPFQRLGYPADRPP